MARACEICSILPDLKPEFILYEGEHWVANLREHDQTLLGTTFITARRHVPELDYLSPEEDRELIVVRNAIIGAIRVGFEPLTFNTSCLKNNAFKEDPDHIGSEEAHVHWHIKPRYGTQPMSFGGETFQDPMPGRYLTEFKRHQPSHGTAWAIADVIRLHLVI